MTRSFASKVREGSPKSRREFLRETGLIAAGSSVPLFVPSSALGLGGQVAPSERITLGVIGIGPRATYNLQAMLNLPDIWCLAIADVSAERRKNGKAMVDQHYGNQDCRVYRDLRELLDRKDIDTVMVATGDRWHATASIMAARAGKHVYCEKPCGLTISSVRKFLAFLRKRGRSSKREPNAAVSPISSLPCNWLRVGSWERSTLSMRPFMSRCWTTPGCRERRHPRRKSSTGICGWVRRSGAHITKPMCRDSGVASGISTRAPDYSTGVPTLWICASGLSGQMIPCRWSTSLRTAGSFADTPTACNSFWNF